MARPVSHANSPEATLLSNFSQKDYTQEFQDVLKKSFILAILRSDLPKEVKDGVILINKLKEISNEAEKEVQLDLFIQRFINNKAIGSKIIELDSKLQDLLRRARKQASANIIDEYKKKNLDQSHSLRSELAKCAQKGIAAKDVQHYLNEQFRACFSLTGHPTNPCTLEYTKLGYKIDAALDHMSQINGPDFEKLLNEVILCPLAGVKKTPKEEAQEISLALETIYNSFSNLKNHLQRAIDYSPYAKQIALPKNFLELRVWTHGGDADGNANITPEVLDMGYEMLEAKIKELYLQDLERLRNAYRAHNIEFERIIKNQFANPTLLKEALLGLRNTTEKENIDIADLVSKIDHFGYDFAKVDIRHNAKDLMTTLTELVKLRGVPAFDEIEPKSQEQLIAEWLKSDEAVKTLIEINPEEIKNETAKKIFLRLQIAGRNPGKSDKLIIADTQGAHHALAAMLLLKATGNKVAQEGAQIDIVTLSESVEDLQDIHDVQKSLLANEIYREHLKHRGQIIQMIAKSDTIRVGGPGAEYYQDAAAGSAYLLKEEAQKYGLNLNVRAFNGGGAALQRGGGRPLEVANRHAKAGIEAGASHKAPSEMTIQGHQCNLLFASDALVINTIEEAATQNMHSALLIEKKLPTKENIEHFKAERKDFYDTAIAAYQAKYFDNPYIVELFNNSNSIGVMLGNASSRPNVRGGKVVRVESGVTVKALQDLTSVFKKRAITLDRTTAHSGTFAIMFMGLREAFESAPSHSMRAVFNESKAFRDFIRNQITTLFMVDLDHAWQMMAGHKRPSEQDIADVAPLFENKETMKTLSLPDRQAVTLAYLDKYINDVAKSIYNSLTGEVCLEGEKFDLKSLMKIYNIDLYNEMTNREKEASILKKLEQFQVSHFNKNPDYQLDQHDIDEAVNLYVGCEVSTNAPVGMTKLLSSVKSRSADSPETPAISGNQDKVASFSERIDPNNLRLPLCLESLKIERNQQQIRTH